MIRRWLRRNVLGLVAIFLALNGTAIAVQVADQRNQKADASKKKKKGKPGPAGPAGPAGAPGAPGAPGAAGTTGQDATTVFGTGQVSTAGGPVDVPGLTQTVTVPAGADVLVASDGGVENPATTLGAADIALRIDSTAPADGFSRRVFSGDPADVGTWSFSGVAPVGPGTHTFTVRASPGSGFPVNVSGDTNSVLQGALTVTILKN
jgi:hypothetical protein